MLGSFKTFWTFLYEHYNALKLEPHSIIHLFISLVSNYSILGHNITMDTIKGDSYFFYVTRFPTSSWTVS